MSGPISLPPAPEQQLVAALRRGERAAFERLYDSYGAALYGVIHKIVKDDEVAQDLVQEAFVKIWQGVHGYDSSRGRLFTWMLNVSRNLAIDHLRSRTAKQQTNIYPLENSVHLGQEDGTPTALPDLGIVKQQLARLRAEHQVVIDLVYFQGYTHAEVAEALEIPLGTAKTRIRNAITELRAQLD